MSELGGDNRSLEMGLMGPTPKEILYAASARDLASDSRLAVVKIGITATEADRRIKQLNGTKMPIAVELTGAWSFEDSPLSADAVEKAAHYLLAPFNVNGEWFSDPDDDLADRVGRFAERLGGKPVGDETKELFDLNEKKRVALQEMKAAFEPVRTKLDEAGVAWEYMTWKVGMDSPYGRMNIQVRKSGKLYVRLLAKSDDAVESLDRTGISWGVGADRRCHSDMEMAQLLALVTGIKNN